MNYSSPEYTNKVFSDVKDRIISEFNVVPEQRPIAFVLGGQGAAGKSDLIKLINYNNEKKFIVVNGDNYRYFHPEYERLLKDVKSFSQETQLYSNLFTENLIKEAIENRYNVIIEGTMRNPETPLNTAKILRNNGFEVHAAVIAAHPKITELGLYNRFNEEYTKTGFGRLADVSSHNDASVNMLKSINELYVSRAVDAIHIYASFPLREVNILTLNGHMWDDRMFPADYIKKERELQIQNKGFVSERIRIGEELSRNIIPSLKKEVDEVVSQLKGFQMEEKKAVKINDWPSLSYKELRERVSILQVAEALEYKPVRDKTTSFRPVLRNASGDTIIIKNPTEPGLQLFQNPGTNERGSVIDFVKNRLNDFGQYGPFRNDTDGINKVLNHFAGVSYDHNSYIESHGYAKQKSFNINDQVFTDATLNKLKFLSNERKISDDTLKTFLPFIKLVKNRDFYNIGFPYVVPGNESIKGFELRNYNFKSFSAGGDKVNACWQACLANDKALVKDIYVSESAIDAMSFFELNRNKIDENSLFVSLGGHMTVNQIINLKNEYPNARFKSCFDNDLAGNLYDIKLSCLVKGKACTMNKVGDTIAFSIDDKKFSLEKDKVSLKNFAKEVGCSGYGKVIDIHKPKGKDWNQVLQEKNTLSAVKKPVFRRKI